MIYSVFCIPWIAPDYYNHDFIWFFLACCCLRVARKKQACGKMDQAAQPRCELHQESAVVPVLLRVRSRQRNPASHPAARNPGARDPGPRSPPNPTFIRPVMPRKRPALGAARQLLTGLVAARRSRDHSGPAAFGFQLHLDNLLFPLFRWFG